jgi:Cdc6-like AAA superfamily ATPase
MRITEPRKAYVEIYRQLTGKTVTWEQAYNLLDKRFSTPSPRRVSTILIVDELDILCNKRQDVVYNLLNWPNLNSARLIVVTIANTMVCKLYFELNFFKVIFSSSLGPPRESFHGKSYFAFRINTTHIPTLFT